MSKILVVTFVFFVVHFQSRAQYLWANSGGGTSDEPTISVVTDSQGNVYAAGNYEDPVTLFSNGVSSPINTSGVDGCYIWKMDALGNLSWIVPISGYEVKVNALAISPLDELYVVGTFHSDLIVPPMDTITSYGVADCFLIKLTTDGVVERLGSYGGWENDAVRDISCDVNGDILLIGSSFQPDDITPGPAVVSSPTGGGYIMKLDKEWNLIWYKYVYLYLSKISIDENHNLYMSGQFNATIDFDPSAASYQLTAANDFDAFLLSLDADGEFRWVRKLSGEDANGSYDSGRSVCTDKNGFVYFVGQCEGNLTVQTVTGNVTTTSNGLYDFFIQKYSTTGDLIWHQSYGGQGWNNCQDVLADSLGNVYLTGSFQGTADFDFGSNTEILTSTPVKFYFLHLLSDGSFSSVRSTEGDCISYGFDIAASNPDELYVVGAFAGDMIFGPQSSVPTILSNGSIDGMVIKMGNVVGLDNASDVVIPLVYPNPATTSFEVLDAENIASIRILDVLGKEVLFTESVGEIFNVEQLNSGTYLIILSDLNGLFSYQKLVKN